MAEKKGTKIFHQLAEVNAMIIDLRDAEGDSLSLASHLMSFFVAQKTVLANVIYEKQELRETLVASQNLGFERFKDNFPLYILTSSFVSGSGEFLSYTLKHLNKAVIVGENTMGVAYISKSKEINEFININLPIAIPIHPLTHSNWEQEGVIPDYPVEAKLSFDVAYNLAKNHLGI